MSRRKTAVGIAVLFALALTAFSAASASAAGSTAYTCVSDSVDGTLFGPHCLKTSTGDNGKYKHVGFSTATTATATNANTASNTTAAQSIVLRGTLVGVNTEITCSSVHGEGPIKNAEEFLFMFAHFEAVLSFTGCVVKSPNEKGCKVKGGAITTNTITGRSFLSSEQLKIEPKEEGAKFAEITIEGCSVAGLNNTFPVTGFLEAKINGATLISTHAEVTTQGNLKLGGQKAGLEGALTLKAHQNGAEETKPIGITET